MREVMKINLGTVAKVKAFVTAAMQFSEQIDLKSGRYTVDAKSMMGVFSLNLSDPIAVLANLNADVDKIKEYFAEWAV